jgi:hypothetical protein
MTTPLIERMLEKNPAAVARSAQLTPADVERILGYDPKIPDTPENRADFVAAWIVQGAEVDHWDIAIWFAPTEVERNHLITERYKEIIAEADRRHEAAILVRYGGPACTACCQDYREMVEAKVCDRCHPAFREDLAAWEVEWKKQEAAEEEDRRAQDYD